MHYFRMCEWEHGSVTPHAYSELCQTYQSTDQRTYMAHRKVTLSIIFPIQALTINTISKQNPTSKIDKLSHATNHRTMQGTSSKTRLAVTNSDESFSNNFSTKGFGSHNEEHDNRLKSTLTICVNPIYRTTNLV